MNTLTGKTVSSTYLQLVQEVDGSYYRGDGTPIDILDVSILLPYLSPFIPDSSLNQDQFFWNNGVLDVSIIGGDGVSKLYVDTELSYRDTSINWLYINKVDPSVDYNIYNPRPGDTSLYYTGELITKIETTNDIGLKTVDIVYDSNDEVAAVFINNYDENEKQITFEKDSEGNIINIHTV